MENDKMYELVCKGKFEELGKKMDVLTDLLKGKNGDAGLVDDVRQLKTVHKYLFGAVIFVLCSGIAQILHWIFSKL